MNCQNSSDNYYENNYYSCLYVLLIRYNNNNNGNTELMWLVVDHFCVVSRKDEFWLHLFGSNIIRVFRIRSAGGGIHTACM